MGPDPPLACRYSAGRFPRHAAINDFIKWALTAPGFSPVLEPSGLDWGDDKIPNGMTPIINYWYW